MSIDPVAATFLVVLITVAAFVNGTIGFGFALLAVNALAVVLDARNGVIAMSLMAPVIAGLQAWHHRDRFRLAGRLRTMLVGALVGTLIGTQILVLLPAPAIAAGLGLFTMWYVVDSLRRTRAPMTGTTERWLGPAAGLLGGLSNGTLGASGPVFGTYLTAIGLRAADFAFAISLTFVSMSLVRILLLAGLGQYTTSLATLALALTVPAIIAQRVGLWFKGRLPEALLYRGVLVVLFVAGINLLGRAIFEVAGL